MFKHAPSPLTEELEKLYELPSVPDVTEPVTVVEKPVIPADPVLRTLTKALEKVSRPGGWIKGALRRRKVVPGGKDTFGYCMVGAVQASTRNASLQRETLSYLQDKDINKNWGSIPSFNDDGRTTLRQVKAQFRKAIARRERDLGVRS